MAGLSASAYLGSFKLLTHDRAFRAIGPRHGRDHRIFAGIFQEADDPFVAVAGFVRQQDVGLHGRQKVVVADEIVSLTAGQHEADRVAKSLDQGMDFRAQPASGSPDGLVFAVFFLAPALC
jgi:hypothetical protein